MFPATRRSVLLAARDLDPEVRRQALGTLIDSYWKPVYKYLRVQHRAEGDEAQDLAQSFFALALEKGTFDRYDPAKARFRTFLRLVLDGFVANERKAARREKRGGGMAALSLDFEGAEAELARSEEYFHREWIRALFARAVERLRAEAHPRRFLLFERHDLEEVRPTYSELAGELGITTVQVTNDLAAARRDFRRLVLDELRALTGSEAEFRAEARDVLGVDPA
jgi:RNA polymerase sigma factor (sigma-70 family)